jgi:hypothetical protein
LHAASSSRLLKAFGPKGLRSHKGTPRKREKEKDREIERERERER